MTITEFSEFILNRYKLTSRRGALGLLLGVSREPRTAIHRLEHTPNPSRPARTSGLLGSDAGQYDAMKGHGRPLRRGVLGGGLGSINVGVDQFALAHAEFLGDGPCSRWRARLDLNGIWNPLLVLRQLRSPHGRHGQRLTDQDLWTRRKVFDLASRRLVCGHRSPP